MRHVFRFNWKNIIPKPAPDIALRPYEQLAQAIIEQACLDYTRCLRMCQTEPSPLSQELERFFLSEWFQMLTDVDGQYLMDRMKSITLCQECQGEQSTLLSLPMLHQSEMCQTEPSPLSQEMCQTEPSPLSQSSLGGAYEPGSR